MEEHIRRQRWQYDDEPTENVEGDGGVLRVPHAVHCRAQVVPASLQLIFNMMSIKIFTNYYIFSEKDIYISQYLEICVVCNPNDVNNKSQRKSL